MSLTINFDNTYARQLPGFYIERNPAPVAAPTLLYWNAPLAAELQLSVDANDKAALAAVFSGNTVPAGAQPIAQVYAGHQFGGFSPRLGDGRALLLGEVIDRNDQRRDIAFKGSGRTPYSRSGDGKAAVGPMLREVLIGEAMHALGIPTTRALAVVATGEPVLREEPLPGAVLTRIAASHLRVGTFQYFAARGEMDQVRQLADYAIARHDPELLNDDTPQRYLRLLQAVAARQAALIAQWMNVGFIHGVMNTDNMTISGETIDYGPCAFMEAYDPRTVFSSIDQHGRYAYGNQSQIAQWNLARLAECLLPLMDADADRALEQATAVIEAFPALYAQALLVGQRAKLGLQASSDADTATDKQLIGDWLDLLQRNRVDFTLAWHHLADAALGSDAPLRAMFADTDALQAWLTRWEARYAIEDQRNESNNSDAAQARTTRAQAMRAVNPWIIPRNHRVEEALRAAWEHNDLTPFERLLSALQNPFVEDAAFAQYAEPAPQEVTACYQTFCGT